MPQLAQAQCDIISRRRSRSSAVRGTMKEIPTGSPVAGEAKVIASLSVASCCISYSAATDFTPLRSAGCVVTSLTRSPLIHTSRGCSFSPVIYSCPVRAGIVFHLLWREFHGCCA